MSVVSLFFFIAQTRLTRREMSKAKIAPDCRHTEVLVEHKASPHTFVPFAGEHRGSVGKTLLHNATRTIFVTAAPFSMIC